MFKFSCRGIRRSKEKTQSQVKSWKGHVNQQQEGILVWKSWEKGFAGTKKDAAVFERGHASPITGGPKICADRKVPFAAGRLRKEISGGVG